MSAILATLHVAALADARKHCQAHIERVYPAVSTGTTDKGRKGVTRNELNAATKQDVNGREWPWWSPDLSAAKLLALGSSGDRLG